MFFGLLLTFSSNAYAAGDESYWGYNTEQTKWTHGNPSNPVQYPIYTGQTQLCGTLYVWNTGNKLHVKYMKLSGKWLGFSEYHLQVDCSFQDLLDAVVNQDGDGNPVPGQCEYQGSFDMVNEMEIEASISGCSDNIWIFAHSVICYYPPG